MRKDPQHAGRPSGIPPQLWQRVGSAPHRLLLLDYDGTLAPFQVHRERALAPPRTLELLDAIAAQSHCDLAVISGRPLIELESLLGPLRATLIGEHGWETRHPGGPIEQRPLRPEWIETLDRAQRAALDRGMGGLLERKRTGLVLHTRGVVGDGLARELEDQTWALWQAAADGNAIRVERIDGGVELRLCGCNKGTAVRELVSGAPRDTLPVFVGDDLSDEDAFAAVARPGFGVRVGGGERPTAATAWLPDCAAVTGFLEHWLEAVRRTGERAEAAPEGTRS